MRILIIGLNYLPESVSIGPYTADLAEYLTQKGHHVQVITSFPLAPQWRIWEEYRDKLIMRESINGVPVLRTYVFVPSRPQVTFNRVLFDISFSLSAFLGGLSSGRCHLIIVVSPPLQLGISGWILSRLKGAKLFFHINDLVPEAALATGAMKEKSIAVRLARYLEHFVYQKADLVGVICDGFKKNLLGKGVAQEKIVDFPVYIDLEIFQPSKNENEFRHKHGFSRSDFIVMYSGSVGKKHSLETMIEAAGKLRDYPDIWFLVISEGPYVSKLNDLAETLMVTNIRFLPLQPRKTLPDQFSAADLLVIANRRSVTDVLFPSKLLFYMAAGRPVLAAVNRSSETGIFIRENNVGLVIEPEDSSAFAKAILNLITMDLYQMGVNGRKVVEKRFNRNDVLEEFAKKIEKL